MAELDPEFPVHSSSHPLICYLPACVGGRSGGQVQLAYGRNLGWCKGVGPMGMSKLFHGLAQTHLFFSIFRKSTNSFLRSKKGEGMRPQPHKALLRGSGLTTKLLKGALLQFDYAP